MHTDDADTVQIEVSHLSLKEGTGTMKDPKIKRLYVSYNFLGIAPAELVTPISLPKPNNSRQQLEFNSRKVIHVDIENNYEKRQYLASMLLTDCPDNGRIQFTVVCEPPEDDDSADCFDVGVANVSLPDILKSGKNLTDADITVYDVDNDKEEIGTLRISIECLNMLKAIREEIPEDYNDEDKPNGAASAAIGSSMTSGNASSGCREVEVLQVKLQMDGGDAKEVMNTALPANKRPSASLTHGDDTDKVTIKVSHLSLREGSGIMKDPEIKNLYVAYNFLGVDPAELETPISRPKDYNSRLQLEFNFRKVFHVDIEKNYENRQYLARMLLPDCPNNGRIQFTVVCEPPEDDDPADCADVGLAYVSLPDLLKSGNNLTDADIAVYDVENEKEEIGTLNISIECLNTLKTIKEEL